MKQGNLKAIVSNGLAARSFNVWDENDTPEAWTGTKVKKNEEYKLVPVLYAAWQLRCKAFADLPFCIYGEGDNEIDNSDDYQNAVKFLPDPYQAFWKAEGSLAGMGSFYFFNEHNRAVTTALRYWTADTITEIKYDTTKYVPKKFERLVGKGDKRWYDAEDVLYCWLPDPAVELGPPTMWPLLSAMMTASSLDSVNKFINDYAARGMTKMFLLAISGNPPQQEKDKIESWWNSLWNKIQVRWRVFNADKITPTVIGDGLEALRGTEVTRGMQEQILAAMGVPASLVMADAANYATAQQDVRTFYQNTIMPDARIVQSSFNTQIFEPQGYHLEFEPERLETFQADEAERAVSLSTLAGTLTNSAPEAVTLSMSILGYDLTEDQQKMLDDMVTRKQESREQVAEQLEPDDKEEKEELAKFQRKALKRIGKDVVFESDHIPADRLAAIHAALPACESEDDVRAAFLVKSAPETGKVEKLVEAMWAEVKAIALTHGVTS